MSESSDDRPADDVLKSLRRIMRGDRGGAGGSSSGKARGGLFRRREAGAEPIPEPAVAEVGVAEAALAESAAAETGVVAGAAPVADDTLLSLDDFILEPIAPEETKPEPASQATPEQAPEPASEPASAENEVADGASEAAGEDAVAEPAATEAAVAMASPPQAEAPAPDLEALSEEAVEPTAEPDPKPEASDNLNVAYDPSAELEAAAAEALGGVDADDGQTVEQEAPSPSAGLAPPAWDPDPEDTGFMPQSSARSTEDAGAEVDNLPAAQAAVSGPEDQSGSDAGVPALAEAGQGRAVIMDESALEDMIRRVIRSELMEGDLGRNISANVQRMIEDEIARKMLGRPPS
ncbi:MAG: hypothetical protein AAF675_05615 [Pseudomonadota bacterium]